MSSRPERMNSSAAPPIALGCTSHSCRSKSRRAEGGRDSEDERSWGEAGREGGKMSGRGGMMKAAS